MKKLFFFAALAAAVLTSCVKTHDTHKYTSPSDAVSFSVYTPKAVTKAGTPGTITDAGADLTIGDLTTATTALQTTGFGVFATFSDHADYDCAQTPNFMYNQHVTYSTSWEYTPLKYWPNETIDDHNNAYGPESTYGDKLSFFAYAPFVTSAYTGVIGGGSETTGISALTSNSENTKDPTVTFKLSTTPDTAVDLLWAVAPSGGISYTNVHNTTTSVSAGMPLVNLMKPSTPQVLPFRFRHATARLGLTIVGAFDQVAAGGTKDANTNVTVESVTLSLPAYTQADLNLKNTSANTPLWVSQTGDGASSVLTVSGTNLNTSIKDDISGGAFAQTASVDETERNLMVNSNTFFTLIPRTTSTVVRVTITYYVNTTDGYLTGGGSRVQNVIYKDITFADGFDAGKAYNIKIILGLTSVKLTASVEDWVTDLDGDPLTNDDFPVDLPINN